MSDTATPDSTILPDQHAASASRPTPSEIDATLNLRFAALQTTDQLRSEYDSQGFLYIEDFLPRDYTERLAAAVKDVTPAVNRNYLPSHKAGGSVSRHTLDQLAPFIADLYRSPAFIKGWNRSPATSCKSRPPTIRTPMRCTSTPSRAITSAGTTTPRITKAAATPCCSA